jgi:PAS domain S-box-containing protein
MLLRANQRLALFAWFCVAWFNVLVLKQVEALGAEKKTVVALYGEANFVPAERMIQEGLTAALLKTSEWDLEVYSENLEFTRFPAAEYGEGILHYLQERYTTRKPDVLIVDTIAVLQFLLDHRDSLFPGVPIVFTGIDYREVESRRLPPDVVGLWMGWDYQRTLELALQLQPKTREVVCVIGTSVEEQLWKNEERKDLERFADRIRIRWLDQLPLQAELDQVTRLPPDSVVLYVTVFSDATGHSYVPFEVAKRLADASSVPVYAVVKTQLPQGIVGGALLDFSEVGSKTAELAFRVLRGEKLPPLSPPDAATNPLLVNWQALKKWHVDESRIPSNATVVDRSPSLWDEHPRLIIATVAVLILQSLLIVGLLVQRSRMKRAEASRRESEERLNLATTSAGAGLWAIDQTKTQIWLTDRARQLFGFAAGESPDWKKLLSTIHPDDREHVQNSVDEALRTGKEFVEEFRMVCMDGSARWIASRGRTQFGSNANLQRLMGACVDITDRKGAEQEIKRIRGLEVEMRQVSRTEMMGGLTASLAHELNQPLGAVQLNAETARLFLAAKSPELDNVKAAIDDVIQDSARAAEIIRNVRALFQRAEAEMLVVDLRQILYDVERILRADAASKGVTLQLDVPTALPPVMGNKTQIIEAVINLVSNGVDSVCEGGKVGRVEIRASQPEAGRVCVLVRDSGKGIEPEVMPRLFDAFFTTKPKGMGMGLAIVRSIIENHGGRIWATCNSDRGATFEFELPVKADLH